VIKVHWICPDCGAVMSNEDVDCVNCFGEGIEEVHEK